MNNLEKMVAAYKDNLSAAVGNFVKFTGTAGCSYDKMTKEEVVISIKNDDKVQNHIGQVHAAAMVLIAETATGMVVGMNIPDDKLLLMKSMDVKFVKMSKGDMKAVATLTPEQIQLIHDEPKGEVVVPVTVTDESENEPVVCAMTWAWIPKKK